jgi:hypothetical protein
MVKNSYENGKVYFVQPIVNHEEDEIYVGSTKKLYLSQRMDKHRSDYKRWKDGKANKLTCFDLFDKYGVENCKITLLEKYSCNSKDELTAKEAEYIKKLDCVNKQIPGRTKKEYRIDNKEEISIYNKKYKEEHKEEISENVKKYRENNKEKIAETKKIYRENHKEEIQEYNKKRREENKEYYQEYNKKNAQTIIHCVCGLTYKGKNHKNRHERTKIHIENMERLNQEINQEENEN